MTTCLRLDDEMDLQAFAASLSEDWCWQLRGRLHKLCFDGPLEAVAEAPAGKTSRHSRIGTAMCIEVVSGRRR